MKTLCVEENIIWWERGAARIDCCCSRLAGVAYRTLEKPNVCLPCKVGWLYYIVSDNVIVDWYWEKLYILLGFQVEIGPGHTLSTLSRCPSTCVRRARAPTSNLKLESSLLNWSTRFQLFSKQSMHNQQENMTVRVHVAQYHQLWFVDALENKVACKLVAYQGDGYWLRECRLQSSQSPKLIRNHQTAESWELSTLEHSVDFPWETGKPSNLTIYLLCDFSVDVPDSRNDTTRTETWLIFNTLHTTLDSTVQWSSFTTRYVIFFHGNLSRFFPRWHFPRFSPPPSYLSTFFQCQFFSTFCPKKIPRDFFTFFPLFGFSHFPHTLFPHFFPIFSMNFFSHFFPDIFLTFPLLFFPHFSHTIFFTAFPHFSLVIFSTFFSHYFSHSFSTLFPCYFFHIFLTLFFSQLFHTFPMCYYFSHFSHAILFHIFFHTTFFTVFPQFSHVIVFHVFFTLFSQYSFPHFFHILFTVFFSTFFPHHSFHKFSTFFPHFSHNTIFHIFSKLFFSQFFHTFPMLLFPTVHPHNSFPHFPHTTHTHIASSTFFVEYFFLL